MMAALMEGSQDDFTRQLINALPHITVSDERRQPPRQPAETVYRGGRDPRPDARGAPARHQESDGHGGRARGLGAGRGRAIGEDQGHHPLRGPRRGASVHAASIRSASPRSRSSRRRCARAR